MFSTKAPSRKSSHHRRESDTDRATKRKTISSTDMRLTFENIICAVSAYPEVMLDKDSVVNCLKSVYDWMVFDSDMQLNLPIVPGSAQLKMWPHGAKVNTRRQSDVVVGENSPRKLKDIDEKCMVNIASSVVSSNLEDQRSVKSKGEVITVAPKGTLQYQSPQAVRYPSSVPSSQYTGPIRMVPEAYQYNQGIESGRNVQFQQQDEQAYHYTPMSRQNVAPLDYGMSPIEGYGGPPNVASPQAQRNIEQEYQPVQSTRRVIPRYSVIGHSVPPAVAEETPEPAHAEVFIGRKARKPKVGTARRRRDLETEVGVQDERDGVPVTFADE
jgi:hypothetical protein